MTIEGSTVDILGGIANLQSKDTRRAAFKDRRTSNDPLLVE